MPSIVDQPFTALEADPQQVELVRRYGNEVHFGDASRVDLLRARFSTRTRAWIELLGCVALLFPFCVIVAFDSWGFFWVSFSIGERSANPSGLPARYLIKGVLFAAMLLLAVQSLGVASRNLAILLRREAD